MKKSPKAKESVVSSPSSVAEPPAANGGRAPAPPAPELKVVPWKMVRPDPNQPRKDFNAEKMTGLVDSIKEHGIAQPILVELIPAEIAVHKPDLINKDWQATDRAGAVVFEGSEEAVELFSRFRTEPFYQIVDGERRWRAAELAGLTEVPVMTRTDIEERKRLSLQIVINQQHQALTELEEAATIDKMRKGGQFENDEAIWKSLGISRGTFFFRVALLRLHEPVREALIAGKINSSVAAAVAMIPEPKAQEKLLKEITDEESYHFPFSYRDVLELIEDEYVKQLKDAPFDLKDGELMHEMGQGGGTVLYGGPCTTCVARSGNMKAQFPDIKNTNVCTRPDCFAKKCEAHFATEAEEARTKGQTVLTAVEFKKNKSNLVKGDDYIRGVYKTWDKAMGGKKPKPTMVVTAAGLEKFYIKDEALTAAKSNGTRFPSQEKPEDKAKKVEKEKEAQVLRESRDRLVQGLAAQLAAAFNAMKDAEAWELLDGQVEINSYQKFEAAVLKLCKGERARVLASVLADNMSRGQTDWETGKWDKDALAAWKALGIDLEAEETKLAQAKNPALPLAKGKPTQKELPGTAVKPPKRKIKKKK